MIHIFDRNYYRYYGRILVKNDMAYLGYTNSFVEFYVKGDKNNATVVTATIGSDVEKQVDWTRLKVYIDDELATKEPIVLDELVKTYEIAKLNDTEVHKITIIKVTEAQMSYAELRSIDIENGTLLPLPSDEDTRVKVEFIGDSITCGYGVLGEPHSEFHIREEDGELSYAALTSKELKRSLHRRIRLWCLLRVYRQRRRYPSKSLSIHKLLGRQNHRIRLPRLHP